MSPRLIKTVALAGVLVSCGFLSQSFAQAAPSPAVTRLVLVDTTTQKDLRDLGAANNISLQADGSALNIRAEGNSSVRSIAFYYDGAHVRTENVEPFAFWADDSGKFRKWTPTVGTHQLRVVPYSSTDRKGTQGPALEITLNVSTATETPLPPSGLAVTKLTLVNASTQKDIRTLSPGAVIDLSADGSALNIRADVSGKPGSIAFTLNGKTITENIAPYAIGGDDSGKFRKWTPPLGSHVLRATPYSSTDRKGTVGTPLEFAITVVQKATDNPAPQPDPEPNGLAVTKLTLVNASTQKDIRTLSSDDVIDLSADGSALNIRADVSGKPGSIAFTLNGKTITENIAPYAIGGDDSGKFRKWTPPLGSHVLRATPYSSTDRKGTVGTPLEFAITVVQKSTGNPAPQPDPEPEPEPVDQQPSPEPDPSGSLASKLYDAAGKLNVSLYNKLATTFDKAMTEMRLGPAFADLSPNAADDRPTLYRPPSFSRTSGYIRTNPYELGGPPKTDGDYWSESGQVGYIPVDPSDPGLDRIQVYAYYDRVFAISPRLDWASGKPHPDPQTREPYYATFFGELPKYPVAMARNYGMQCNEALVLYKGGKLAVAATQTSRNGSERPYPAFQFPANKVPTGIAMTTGNEFALVTIWDTATKKGQLAVFALEAKYLPFHTWPYIAMPNQGSWSALKLLGYVDLPMAMPSSVAAASNGWWSGPSQTGNLVLSQIELGKDNHRKNVYDGGWSGVVARGGYAIVASKFDNKVALVDLAPLFGYVRESYLSSANSFKKTMAARGTSDSSFPEAFSVKPAITPKVVWQADISSPNAVLAGFKMDRWTKDYYKAYVASEDGTISIIDTTPLIRRASWERLGSLRIAGTFNVGRNPVSMCFTRRGDGNLPLIPRKADGTQYEPDPFNNLFYIAVRGDRKVVAAVTFEGKGAVYRTIKDKRLEDPVAVSTAIRGPILSVTDFRGKKMVSFRVGRINDARNKKVYGAGASGNDPFEFAGEVPFNGYPFLINTTNVN
jgi:hypothetical protein